MVTTERIQAAGGYPAVLAEVEALQHPPPPGAGLANIRSQELSNRGHELDAK